ncbi:hypothetical protein ZHAS_00012054 [Anopheles sinensis]|uniref:Uncharacterized protein n=1 Tax=Anopheles sinensis TaxID=74873 RepID=A0A084W231_ANOSI|nr:hypothetical protein ZHAS_00012054 [Anopheles sinensis]
MDDKQGFTLLLYCYCLWQLSMTGGRAKSSFGSEADSARTVGGFVLVPRKRKFPTGTKQAFGLQSLNSFVSAFRGTSTACVAFRGTQICFSDPCRRRTYW